MRKRSKMRRKRRRQGDRMKTYMGLHRTANGSLVMLNRAALMKLVNKGLRIHFHQNLTSVLPELGKASAACSRSFLLMVFL